MKLKPTIEERLLKDLKKEITYELDKLIIEDLRATQEKKIKQIQKQTKRNTMSIFKDQEKFMIAGDQSVDNYNESQYNMYLDLIKEEVQELQDAVDQDDKVEQLDALIDILVVVVGALHSLGADAEGAWNEVIRSNMSKVDPATGKVIKREDGKVLKPATYSAPELEQFLNKTKG